MTGARQRRRGAPDGRATVLIDATAVPVDRGGVGRYVDGLISALEPPFAVVCQSRDGDYYAALATGATILPQHPLISRIPVRMLWEQLVLPRVARRCGAQVIHSPHYTLPLITRARRIVTFHDATFFSDPVVHTAVKRRFFTAWARMSARLAHTVIVPSRSTGDEFSRFGIRARYVVAYHGVDPEVFHEPTDDELEVRAEALGLSARPWIAFLGTLEPRKNLTALVRAYSMVARARAAQSEPVPTLVLAGGHGWDTELDAELATITSPAEVIRLGFVPVDDLRVVLGGAVVVAYPSLGEGFGLPVLEAMACGAPVLTTRRLALPEVGGDAVAYTDVDDASIAEALESLLDDPALRAELATAGLARSAAFTWQASAAVHEKVYAGAAS